MSVQAMAWAIEQRRETDPTARHLLLAMGNYADKTGRNCFPSVATLASDTGLSERTIRQKLAQLEAAGLIRRGNQRIAEVEIARADRRPVVYNLDLPEARGAAVAPRYKERGAADGVNGVQLTAERGAPAAPKPKFNQEQSNLEQVRSRGERLPNDWTLPGNWKAWAQGERPDLDIAAEAAKFRDHWHAKAGKDACKVDWAATWRNWVRNAHRAPAPRESVAARVRRLALEGEARDRAAVALGASSTGAVIEGQAVRVEPMADWGFQ